MMEGEKNLQELLNNLSPRLNAGEYAFVSVPEVSEIPRSETLFEFKEKEGVTMIIRREVADKYGLGFSYLASWITLEVHSSLQAVGLTAAFSTALGNAGISCNVVAGYYHDHIFVDHKHRKKAMAVLLELKEGEG